MWADVTEETARAPTRFWPPFLASDAASDVALGLALDEPAQPAPATELPSPPPESRFPSPNRSR